MATSREQKRLKHNLFTMEDREERSTFYLRQSLRYLDNAEKFLSRNNPDKAGEFLWGSVATALKALLMAMKGEEIRSHGQFWDIARELARETRDESLYKSYREANSLHSNFYDSRLTVEDVKEVAPKVARFVRKLTAMTNHALKQNKS